MSTVKIVESEGGDHVFALPVGYVMHEYEVRGVLGHGGFGITYLALDKQLNELVAIKEYLPSYMAGRFSNTTVGPKSNDDKGPFREGVLTVLERSDEWFHVRLNSGETGWSNSKYIACR
jgi:serine/threonine protein kinase